MVNKLTAMNKYPTAHLRCAMDPEWDLLQVIHRLMTTMKERPKFKWVCSHQDDDPDVDITTLSVATKLNIKANALATQDLDKLELNRIRGCRWTCQQRCCFTNGIKPSQETTR